VKKVFLAVTVFCIMAFCQNSELQIPANNKEPATLLENYYD
jgi:hypothetical protein